MSSSTLRFLAVLATAQIASAQAPAGTSASTPAASAAAASAAAMAKEAYAHNINFNNYLLIICGSLVLALTMWRVSTEIVKYVRHLTCLNNDTQAYFSRPSESFATFKKHVLYAPILGRRHNREFQLSSAINVGTLPTRLQFVFIMGYFATNIAFCVASIYWSTSYTAAAKLLRNRTGILAVVNMIPLFVMAGRNNPLINWLNISYDTFNLLHRWFGRIVVLEIIAHTAAWAAATVMTGGWATVWKEVRESELILMGTIGVIAVVAMAIQANSILRHAFYEVFKSIHIALAILVLITLWFHLKLAGYEHKSLLIGVFAIWIFERGIRVFKNLYRNGTGSRAVVEALPGNACRVTIDMPRPWTFKAGQHAYLSMPSVGLMQSHPFSIAWSEEADSVDAEKLAMTRQDILAMKKTTMSFIIRERTGFTRQLLKKAEAAPDGRFTTKVFAEGPYGGMHSMTSYGTVVLFAGGVGITHQVPHVRNLVAGFSNNTVAARKILLVWIIQSPEHLEWIRPWMTAILAMDKRRDVLRIMLFVSRPRSTKEIHSPSATVQMFPGRPNVGALMDSEISNQVGAMGVSVCGSGGLSDDVRRAVRERQDRGNIDFVEEAFSW